MVFYLVAAIVMLTILIYIVTELIHLPKKKKFKKYLKFFFSYYNYLYCFIFNEILSGCNNIYSCNIFNTL